VSLIRTLCRMHDVSSRALFWAAGLALCAAVGFYLFEVTMRYFMNAPTTWTNEAVQYSLAVLIFAALPEVTARSAHVAIDIVPEMLPVRPAALLARLNGLIGAAACTTAAYIVGRESLKQFANGLMTNAANPIPRWWITAVIAVGLASAGLHFFRQALTRAKAGSAGQ
jgi:TRAP-type C4-dicarboxylate transport system permease small subunit